MDYPTFGNVSLGIVSGNIKLYVNDAGLNIKTGIGYNNNSMTFWRRSIYNSYFTNDY